MTTPPATRSVRHVKHPLHPVRLPLSLAVLALVACDAESPTTPESPAPQLAYSGSQPAFGARASGSELFTPGIQTDGGPGSASASLSTANYSAEASFPATATYLPELKAFSQNTTAANDDDRTQATAEAYQVFRSSTARTVSLDVDLSAVVDDATTDGSFVLADVWVYGGADFDVGDSSICPDGSLGRFLFDGTYFCGSNYGRANLFIPVGDLVVSDVLTFDVAAGEDFGVYAILRANSIGGSADATQTLVLDFPDPTGIEPVDPPDGGGPPPPPPPPAVLDFEIDVRPWNRVNRIYLNGRGVIPVAVFGADDLDVGEIDRSSLELAGLQVLQLRRRGPACFSRDVDRDGTRDLVCFFRTDADAWTGPEAGPGTAELSGVLADGTPIAGSDAVRVVPKKRRWWRGRH